MREDKKIQHQTIREYEMEHTKNVQERDTFKFKMSEMSLSNAKSKLEQSKNKKGKQQKNNHELVLPGPRYDANNRITEQKDEEE